MSTVQSEARTRTARPTWRDRTGPLVEPVLLTITLVALLAGVVGWLVGDRGFAAACWVAGTLSAVVPAVMWMAAALRRGRAGVDLIAVLFLVGTLLVDEYLAGP